MSGRVLLYVQHLLGIGHLRRAALIARAIAARGLDVTVMSGGEPGPDGLLAADFGAARIVQLPWVRAADASFKTLLDAAGRPIDEAFREARRALVVATLAEVRPQVLLIEAFPFARRAFRFELLPLLAAAHDRAPRPAVLASVRDIIVAKPDPARTEETCALVERWFDAVLVHGDPDFVPFSASFPGAARLAAKLRYTGYVAPTLPPAAANRSVANRSAGEVIVSAGGGAVGAALLAAALEARALCRLRDAPWRLLTGPNLPAPVADALRLRCPRGVDIERFRPDFPALLASARLSVSQAGYNTVVEVLGAGVPAVFVPFAAGGETEQGQRAAALAARGRAAVVAETDLSPAGLAAAIDQATGRSGDFPPSIALDGASRTAEIVAALAR